jgi:competence protein ComFA
LENHCSNCTEFGILDKSSFLYYIDEEIVLPKYEIKPFDINFTSLQLEASKFIVQLIKEKKDGLIWAVCGAGKTEITFPAIEHALLDKQLICFAIPRIDILYEIYERICLVFPNVTVAILNGNEPKLQDAQIYIMTTNQIIKFKKAFGLIIVDEVDAFPYEYNTKYDYGVKSALNNQGIVVYLTSTPSNLLKAKNLKTYIINRRWHGFDLPVPKLIYSNMNGFKHNRIPLFIYWFINKRKRQQLWFISNIDNGQLIHDVMKLKCNNINIDFVHAKDKNRREKINKFHSGKTDILITTTILERGVTFNDIDVLVLDASNKMYNIAALVQISGRVGRKQDYQQGKVYFFHVGITKTIKEAKKQICKMNKK